MLLVCGMMKMSPLAFNTAETMKYPRHQLEPHKDGTGGGDRGECQDGGPL